MGIVEGLPRVRVESGEGDINPLIGHTRLWTTLYKRKDLVPLPRSETVCLLRVLPDKSRGHGERRQPLNRVDTSLDDPLHPGRLGKTVRTIGDRVSSRDPPGHSRGSRGRR